MNPSESLSAGMSSSESKTLESKSEASENLTATEPSNPSIEEENLGEQTQEEEEEKRESGCKESFIAWEKCIEEGENNKEDIVEKCFEVTAALKKCMEAHSDYYEPVLRAEKAAEEELEREVASRDSEQNKEDANPEEAVSKEK
ncbi:hypothetical protein AAG906_030441 [Vitis piasezkii]